MTVISYPIPAYSNVPIEPQNYQPSRFVISNLTLGQTTTVTATEDMNYVVGQLVRLLIPEVYGSFQINNLSGYVLSIPASNQVVITINSVNANAFIPTPYTSIITNATASNPCVLTSNNFFKAGQLLTISEVAGMTELNGANREILSRTSTTITLDLDASAFTPYTSGGICTLQEPQINTPQIIAVGDVNTGYASSTGRSIPTLNGNTQIEIPGSFINISPQ